VPERAQYACSDGEVFAGTETGRIAFNPPDQMKQFRTERIEARLTRYAKLSLDEFVARMRGTGKPTVEEIILIDRMRATLVGDTKAFEIFERSERDQLVLKTGLSQWQWDVTPLRAGRQKLELRVTCRFKLGSDTEFLDLPTYEREINIRVAPLAVAGRFGARNWQWLAGTAAIPLLIWFTGVAGVDDKVRPWIDGLFKADADIKPAEAQPRAPEPNSNSELLNSQLQARASRAFE
jgi:hypothetical protein